LRGQLYLPPLLLPHLVDIIIIIIVIVRLASIAVVS